MVCTNASERCWIRRCKLTLVALAAATCFVHSTDASAQAPVSVSSEPTSRAVATVRRNSPYVGTWRHRPMTWSETAKRFLPLDPFRLQAAIEAGFGFIGGPASASQHVGRTAPAFYLEFAFGLFDLFEAGGSFGALFPEDQASYEVLVMSTSGGVPMNAKSTVQMPNLSVFGRFSTPRLALAINDERAITSSAYLEAGWSNIRGKRSIDNCYDCPSENLVFTDGAYIGGGLLVGKTWFERSEPTIHVRIAYHHYVGGAALDGELRVGIVGSIL